MHFEIVTAVATAAATTGAAAAAVAGDSLIIKNGLGVIRIASMWASANTTAGFAQVTYPSAHDTTRGYRVGTAAGPIATANAGNLILPLGMRLPIDAQETMAVTLAGGAVAGDIECWSALVWYDNFPGINARLTNFEDVVRRAEKLTTIETSVTAVATGAYNSVAVTTSSDLLQANRDYAVLGLTSRTPAHSLIVSGPDWGNVRMGCPGNLRFELGSQFFAAIGRATGEKMIPVFSSGNKAQTNVGFSGDENAATTLVTMHLALLK